MHQRGDGTAAKHLWAEYVRLYTSDTGRAMLTAGLTYVMDHRSIGFTWQACDGHPCDGPGPTTWYDLPLGPNLLRSRDQPEAFYVRVATVAR